jgi:hypothetical protein
MYYVDQIDNLEIRIGPLNRNGGSSIHEVVSSNPRLTLLFSFPSFYFPSHVSFYH